MNSTFDIYIIKGELVYQERRVISPSKYFDHERIVIERAVRKSDQIYWLYTFHEGSSVGKPLHGKRNQKLILSFVEKVKKALNEVN